MGDDIIDLPAMQRAGFAATVPNAPGYVSQAAHWVASVPGGSGAVRECCDLLLAAQGRLGGFWPRRACWAGRHPVTTRAPHDTYAFWHTR